MEDKLLGLSNQILNPASLLNIIIIYRGAIFVKGKILSPELISVVLAMAPFAIKRL